MDWPLTGAIAGVVVLAGAVTAGAVFALRSTPEPVNKKPQTFVLLLAPPPDTPGYATASFPSNADDDLRIDSRPRQAVEPVTPPVQKKPASQRPEGETLAKANGPQSQNKVGSSSGTDTSGKQPLQVAPERWRVTTTAKASYFNLGGHVDKAGVVDSMASEHLRETFQKHQNFGKLPPDLKAHINNSPNINLVKLAPYRKLLGVNDKWLEEEQGVRFEIAGNR
jgi:hypothetical protein